MKRVLIGCLLLALCAGRAFAQARRGLEFGFGGTAIAAERALDFEGRQHYASGILPGAEAWVSVGRLGFRARIVSGALAAVDDSTALAAATVGDAELRAMFGLTDNLMLDAGLTRRTVQGRLATQVWTTVRVGAHVELRAAETALYFVVGGAFYPSVAMSGVSKTGSGADFESAMQLRFSGNPIRLQLGYRLERRELPGPSITQWERFSGVVLGGGIALGRRASTAR